MMAVNKERNVVLMRKGHERTAQEAEKRRARGHPTASRQEEVLAITWDKADRLNP
jgi:hypothetical protein